MRSALTGGPKSPYDYPSSTRAHRHVHGMAPCAGPSSGISRMRCPPFYEYLRDSSNMLWFKRICVFVCSNWSPLTVPFNPFPLESPNVI